MNREYLEDYEQRERAGWNRLLKKMEEGDFSIEKDRYPPDERFVNIRKPVAVLSSIGSVDAKDMWATIPFCGSLIRYLPPVRQNEFEEVYFKIRDIPKIIDFIRETGRLQVVLTVSNFRAYEGLDFMDPFFELRPPVLVGPSMDFFGDPESIQKALTMFDTIAKIRYVGWLKARYSSLGIPPQVLYSALFRKRNAYTMLKLGNYEILENIENLMVDDPEEAHWLLTVSGIFVTDPLIDMRSDLRIFSLEGIRDSSVLPPNYQPKLQFPCEIGKFLTKKLTYAPLGFEACRELLFHYDSLDLQKVQESLNTAILMNHPEAINKNVEELNVIMDDIWNDKTIPNRIKDIGVGVPVSIAAVGGVAGALVAGPAGAGLLAGLGFKVGEKAMEKFHSVKGNGVSEKLAKLGTRNYQANIYEFKKHYNK